MYDIIARTLSSGFPEVRHLSQFQSIQNCNMTYFPFKFYQSIFFFILQVSSTFSRVLLKTWKIIDWKYWQKMNKVLCRVRIMSCYKLDVCCISVDLILKILYLVQFFIFFYYKIELTYFNNDFLSALFILYAQQSQMIAFW